MYLVICCEAINDCIRIALPHLHVAARYSLLDEGRYWHVADVTSAVKLLIVVQTVKHALQIVVAVRGKLSKCRLKSLGHVLSDAFPMEKCNNFQDLYLAAVVV